MLALAGGLALVRAVSRAASTAPTQALRDHLFELRKKGFNRLFQDGRTVRILDAGIAARHRFRASRCSSWWTASRSRRTCISGWSTRIEICYREAGEVIFESAAGRPALRFNEKFQCKTCGLEFADAGADPVQLQLARRAPARAARASATPSISTWTA